MKSGLAGLCALAVTLYGCASIFEGTAQEITVNTNPAGANCTIERQDKQIAVVPSTPGDATVRKTKYDILIRCKKDGYQEATYLNHSDVAGVVFVNALGGLVSGGIAAGVDSATGADNKYDSVVNITLTPAGTQAALPQRVSPVSASQ